VPAQRRTPRGLRDFAGIRRQPGGYDASLPTKASSVIRRLKKSWHQLGAWMLPGVSLATPGADVHFGGPFGMGLELPHGTGPDGELNAAAGIFIADGSAFPSLPAKYPTLTIMADGRLDCRISIDAVRRINFKAILAN
jgi:hypothetical protein